ncbi:hypothetical protein PCANC_11024 [Puccinia coronata f. sp. avenae]|uniref:Uncharacterized protein n=1 Tax=Puccinia coronata f. sp. avenae TaxID=200324 RepID=A0A2N5USW8_9BASI|nr:hypothetical protein PCANC_11024 [Puccinia coronata f. sp. avenae]
MGSLNCLNAPISLEQRELFVKRNQQNAIAEVSVIQNKDPSPAAAPPLTYQPALDPLEEVNPSELVEFVMGDYQNYDGEYDDYKEPSCLAVNVLVNTVHVRLDCSKGGRLMVPASFKGPNGVMVAANILMDTRAMANFVSKEFIRHTTSSFANARP